MSTYVAEYFQEDKPNYCSQFCTMYAITTFVQVFSASTRFPREQLNVKLHESVRTTFMCMLLFLLLLDFLYRGSLYSIFTTLIYHKVLINNITEQDTEQDKHNKILVEQFTYILTQYIYIQYYNEQCMMDT